jgi:hypothetical protein
MDVRQGVLLLVFVVALFAYHNSLGCELVFDDHLAIETNEDVTDHIKPIFAPDGLFFHDFWGKPLRDEASHKVSCRLYRFTSSLTDPLPYFPFAWSTICMN